jgi:hypothetical protein
MMKLQNLFQAPDKQSFLEVFGIEPTEEIFQDGFYLYEFKDLDEISLKLSFNIIEKWVQTILTSKNVDIAKILHENVHSMNFVKENNNWVIKCDFGCQEYQSQLTIQLLPNIMIHLSTLAI